MTQMPELMAVRQAIQPSGREAMLESFSSSRYRREIRYGPKRIPRLPPAEGHAVLATLEKSDTHALLVAFTHRTFHALKSRSMFRTWFVVVDGMLAATTVHTGAVSESVW